MQADRYFPIMPWRYHAKIPWALVEAHERQALLNHNQTVKRLAERGGLGASELAAVLEDRRWHRMSDADAWAVINKAIADAS